MERVIGSPKDRIAALSRKAELYIINRENVEWLVKHYAGRRLPFDMLVIDSMEVLETMAEIRNRRTDLFYLFEWMRDLGVTVVLISESSSERLIDGKFDEGYLSDGIITLKMQVIRDVEMQRRIRCVKMRETNHDPSYYSLLFNNGRFQVTRVISE